jgi:hypothetical protein
MNFSCVFHVLSVTFLLWSILQNVLIDDVTEITRNTQLKSWNRNVTEITRNTQLKFWNRNVTEIT